MANLSSLVARIPRVLSQGRGAMPGALVCFLFFLVTSRTFQTIAGTEPASVAYLSRVASVNRLWGDSGAALQPLQGEFNCQQQGCQTGGDCMNGKINGPSVSCEIELTPVAYLRAAVSTASVPCPNVMQVGATIPVRTPDFEITESASWDSINCVLTFTIVLTNFQPHLNVVVTDTLPDGLTFCARQLAQPFAGSAQSCGCPVVPDGWTWSINGQTLTFCLPNWQLTNPGGYQSTPPTANPATFKFSVTVDPTKGGSCGEIGRCWTNTATVTACNPAPPTPVSDLSINKTGPSSAIAGSLLTYTITASNLGPDDAPAVTVTDTLPAGLTFSDVKSTGSGDVTTIQGNLASVQIPSLNAKTSETITVTATAPCSGTFVDTATIASGSVIDNVASNNSATVQTVVTPGLVATPAELTFPTVEVSTSPSSPSQQSLTFRVDNTCASSVNVLFGVSRMPTVDNEFQSSDPKKSANADSLFSISDPLTGKLDLTQPVTIPAGGKTFTITFAPAIPRFIPLSGLLSPADVLPVTINSVLAISLPACSPQGV